MTLLLPPLPTARSTLRSPLKSASARQPGWLAAVNVVPRGFDCGDRCGRAAQLEIAAPSKVKAISFRNSFSQRVTWTSISVPFSIFSSLPPPIATEPAPAAPPTISPIAAPFPPPAIAPMIAPAPAPMPPRLIV